MRRASYLKLGVGFLVLGMLTALAGCKGSALRARLLKPSAPPVADSPAADPADELMAQANAHAQHVRSIAQIQETGPPREVLWLDITGERFQTPQTSPTSAVEPAKPMAGPDVIAVKPTADPSPQQPLPASLATLPNADPEKLTQAQVYEQLLKTIRAGDDSNLSKALIAATLGVIEPHGEMDWSMLASLSPQDKNLVERYHKTVSTLRSEALTGGGTIDQGTVAERLDELFGKQPVTIRNIQLCEKVLGFGVYDAFPDHAFVAGRQQKLIVYVELDHFMPVAREQGDGFEVKLRQEIELYESNGFKVWSHEPVLISDISLNKRRDFFIVQLVTLPAQLGLGRYHLKVRVYDENAGTRDESSVDIRLVADRSLVRGSRR